MARTLVIGDEEVPVLIKTIDQIMRERQTDVYFLHFNLSHRGCEADVRRQLAWFDAHEIAYEMAAPDGWLEGNPGCYAVYFAGGSDPTLAAYSADFEDADGGSLKQDVYQMYLMPLAEHD